MEPHVIDAGLIDYTEALVLQKKLWSRVKDGAYPYALIVCQHSPVITLGRLANPRNILVGNAILDKRGIRVVSAERGGEVTYHGPGQLVAYPICNLEDFGKDLYCFLRFLEQLVLELLKDYGIDATRTAGSTGVWIKGMKIASIGIAVRQWICFHGLSICVEKEDLANFSLIRPCGMDIIMTSIESLSARRIPVEEVKRSFVKIFNRNIVVPNPV
ncbi:MAG: lipoyl(octanoyl) transferase LipB [Candidatus Omnitrophica bacterium]|nr:lipoyl(octanoyl) transferase LipB [Candidatus Omnitrophota bacterium]